MTVKTYKEQIIDIMKQAEGKTYTYFTITTKFGLHAQPVVNGLHIHYIGEKTIQVADKIMNVDQFVTLPLTRIDFIERVEEEQMEMLDAEAEYNITYDDGSQVNIVIYNEE